MRWSAESSPGLINAKDFLPFSEAIWQTNDSSFLMGISASIVSWRAWGVGTGLKGRENRSKPRRMESEWGAGECLTTYRRGGGEAVCVRVCIHNTHSTQFAKSNDNAEWFSLNAFLMFAKLIMFITNLLLREYSFDMSIVICFHINKRKMKQWGRMSEFHSIVSDMTSLLNWEPDEYFLISCVLFI